jgi:hypothetical protein
MRQTKVRTLEATEYDGVLREVGAHNFYSPDAIIESDIIGSLGLNPKDWKAMSIGNECFVHNHRGYLNIDQHRSAEVRILRRCTGSVYEEDVTTRLHCFVPIERSFLVSAASDYLDGQDIDVEKIDDTTYCVFSI